MQSFPHLYSVVARADTQGDVALEGERLPPIPSAPPTEFGGPGDRWSPETLFVAAVADRFVLTFRGIAGLSRFSWVSLECNVTGTQEAGIDLSSARPQKLTTELAGEAQLLITMGCGRVAVRGLKRYKGDALSQIRCDSANQRHLRVRHLDRYRGKASPFHSF